MPENGQNEKEQSGSCSTVPGFIVKTLSSEL